MCEFGPGCDITTDPVAKALAAHPRETDAILLVLCPKRSHVLAAVYDLPPYGGLSICLPHMKARAGSLFALGPGDDPCRIVHWHPTIERLADTDGPDSRYSRCRCGTWVFRLSKALEAARVVQSGGWPDRADFVRVRHNVTGQTSVLPKEYFVNFVQPSGEMTLIGQAPGSERLRRPHVLSSYVGMADADAP